MNVFGHEEQRAFLTRASSHAYAFLGASAIGRRRVAAWWSMWLNCTSASTDPCGTCESCRAALLGAHPDYLEKAPNRVTRSGRSSQKPLLTIDQIVPRTGGTADPEPASRWLERPPRFNHRVLVLDDAHLMTENAANAFLKTLEEPPRWAKIVLIAPSLPSLLPTLSSRVVAVRFGAAPIDAFQELGLHPARETGQVGRLVGAQQEPELHEQTQRVTEAFVASLDGSLQEALEAGKEWVKTWADQPDGGVDEFLLAYIKRDTPARYAATLEALERAREAMQAYVGPELVAATLTLNLRSA